MEINEHHVTDHLPVEEIQEDLHNKDWEAVKNKLNDFLVQEIVLLLSVLSPEHQVLAFRSLRPDRAGAVFGKLSLSEQNRLLEQFSDQATVDIIQNMKPDDRTAFLEELPGAITRKLLNLLPPEEYRRITELLTYPEGSVGRQMSSLFVSVGPEWTVQRVREHIGDRGESPETIQTIFVTDERNRFMDALKLEHLLGSKPGTKLTDLMDSRAKSVNVYADAETALDLIRNGEYEAVPVTDDAGILLGVITLDDLLNLSRELTSEDLHRLGGSEPLDGPYWNISTPGLIGKRVGWLLFLFLGGALTSTVIGYFEAQLQSAVILSVFIPLLIGTGGNAGTQSVSSVIRAIAVGEVRWEDALRVSIKEMTAGALIGGVMGLMGILFAMVFWEAGWLVSLVVGLTLPVICVGATLVASFIPLLAERLDLDPTLMSAPLITTAVDAAGLIVYFSIARIVLGI